MLLQSLSSFQNQGVGLKVPTLYSWLVTFVVIFEIASKYCILDSFVDHDGYSISSKGFLPAVVDLACCNSWGRKESDTTERLN